MSSLSEPDLVTSNLTVDQSVLRRIAQQRASM
jgi:hypothetical protein